MPARATHQGASGGRHRANSTAVTAARPRARYTVTPSAKLMIGQRKLLSDRMWDRAMTTQFKRPR